MSRILVTGANGFVGTFLVDELKREHDVTCLVHSSIIGEWQRLALEDTRIVNTDIRNMNDLKQVMVRHRIEQVYHLAALAIVKSAHADPLSVFDVNVMGTVAVLEAARQAKVGRTVVMCTDKVYGSGQGLSEHTPFAKANEPYGASKVCQAVVTESFIHTYDMSVALLHSCNIYGFDPFNDRIVPNVVKQCLRGENPIIFTNDPSVREYVYVKDVVSALSALMSSPALFGSFNVSTGEVYSQEQMVKRILTHFPNINPVYAQSPVLRQLNEQSLISDRWDWASYWKLGKGLNETITMFRTYEKDWWCR